MKQRVVNRRLWIRLQQAAVQEVDGLIRALPDVLCVKAKDLPVSFEPVPNPDLVKDGLDMDVLGLFVGEPYREGESGLENVPAQIILFLENIWQFAGQDSATYREEVRITYLHELGHYLGLDEDDLAVRDLD